MIQSSLRNKEQEYHKMENGDSHMLGFLYGSKIDRRKIILTWWYWKDHPGYISQLSNLRWCTQSQIIRSL